MDIATEMSTMRGYICKVYYVMLLGSFGQVTFSDKMLH